MKKTVIFAFLLSFFLTVMSPIHSFASYNEEIADVKSDIVYVQSLDNDEVILDKNFEKKTSPASLTKIMTALLTLENVDDLTAQYTASKNAIELLANTDSSTASIVAGEKMSVKDLLYCLLVTSANDAAYIIAENVGGSISGFIEMMNNRAQELGMKDTHFVNPHGLDDDDQYSTAKDIAVLVREALKHPLFEKISSTLEYKIGATNMSEERILQTTNKMTNSVYDSYYLSYIKGIKTGSTDKAGKCIVTKASKDGYSYLAIVMGGRATDEDGNEFNGAFADCKTVLKWIYSNIKYKVIADVDQTISVSELRYCWKGEQIRLVPAKEVYALVPNSLDSSSLYYELSDELKKPLQATIKKGEVVGTATAYYGGNAIATIDLTVEETVHHSVILHILSIVKAAWNNLFGKVMIISLFLTIIFLSIANKLIKKGVIDLSEIKYNRKVKKHLK